MAPVKRRVKKGGEALAPENTLIATPASIATATADAAPQPPPRGECRGLGHTHVAGSGCADPSICSASWKCALNTWP